MEFLERCSHCSVARNIPTHMLEALERYLVHGIQPGSFLTAVLCNDLHSACQRADDINRHLLWEYVYVLHNHFPIGAYGRADTVAAWISEKLKERQGAMT